MKKVVPELSKENITGSCYNIWGIWIITACKGAISCIHLAIQQTEVPFSWVSILKYWHCSATFWNTPFLRHNILWDPKRSDDFCRLDLFRMPWWSSLPWYRDLIWSLLLICTFLSWETHCSALNQWGHRFNYPKPKHLMGSSLQNMYTCVCAWEGVCILCNPNHCYF